MKKRISTLLLATLSVTVLQIACRNADDKTTPSKSTSLYAMNVVVSQVPFWTESRTSWESLGKAYGVSTRFGGPQSDDSQKQINEIEALIAQGIAGLVIAPTDSRALTPVINEAINAGIPVITFLVDAPDSKRLLYITSTLEEASKSVGEYAIKSHKPNGKVIISLGTAGSEEQERRADGFRQIVKNYPEMRVVDVVEDKFDTETGADNIKAVLAREGKISYIFGCNSRSAAAAKLALEESGYKKGDAVITAWDHDEDVLALIEQDWVFVSAAQQTSFMTLQAFCVLHAYTNNYLYPPSLDLKSYGVSPVPNKIEVPISLISRDNAAAYYKKK